MRRPKKTTETTITTTECGFGCGRLAQGSISLHWSDWEQRDVYDGRGGRLSPDRSMSVHLPACWQCARGSVALKVSIPADAVSK